MTAVARVAELAEQIRGVSYGKEDVSSTARPGYLPVLRAGNIGEDGLVFDDLVFVPAERISEKQKIRQDDVVIAASSGSLDVVGKAARALVDYDGGFGAFCKVLRPGPDVDPAYFAHYFRTPVYRRRCSALAAGVNINNLRNEHLDRMEIPLPPFPEQRRIAEILDKADALRVKRRAALAQLDALTQSIFLDLFGDPATNPKGFPIAQMGDLCDVRDGTHDSPRYVSDGGYPLVTSKNVTGGLVDLTDVNYISEADYIQINKRSKVDRGDIILPMIGTIGSPVLVDHEPRYAIKNVALIKFTKTSPSAVFVRHLLSSHYFDYIVSQKNRGGTQKFVSLGDLRAFPLPLPSNDEQHEFAHRIKAVDKTRTTSRTSESELTALFTSLQYRAFRGEL
jgi:type I restriction enzyme, S subunit